MIFVAVVAALLTGGFLGMMGGGGSTLAVPTFVYLLHLDPKSAFGMSLGVVGITSIYGGIQHLKTKNYDLRTALYFGIFSVPGAQFGAYIASFISGTLQLILFGCVSIVFSILMYKNGEVRQPQNPAASPDPLARNTWSVLLIQGFFIGVLAGLIGIGGGFIIVPILVLVQNMRIRKAIGTSMLIMAATALSGFCGYLVHMSINWEIFGIYLVGTFVGMHFGIKLMRALPSRVIKRIYALVLFVISLLIIGDNLYHLVR